MVSGYFGNAGVQEGLIRGYGMHHRVWRGGIWTVTTLFTFNMADSYDRHAVIILFVKLTKILRADVDENERVPFPNSNM